MDGPLEHEHAKFHSGVPKVLQKIMHCFLRCRNFKFQSDSAGLRYKDTAVQRITRSYIQTAAPEGQEDQQNRLFMYLDMRILLYPPTPLNDGFIRLCFAFLNMFDVWFVNLFVLLPLDAGSCLGMN